MEKTIWRKQTLDAFSISVDELEELCSLLRQECGNDNDVRTSIEFEFSDETLKFDSVEDIRNQEITYNKVTKFTITMFGDKGYIKLDSRELFHSDAEIRSSSDKESWCAGVNEAITSYLKKKRVWYYWLIRRGVWRSFGIAVVISYLLFLPRYEFIPIHWQALTVLCLLLLWVLFLFGKDWVPAGTIRMSQQRLDIKTVAAVVGALAAVILAIISFINMIIGGD